MLAGGVGAARFLRGLTRRIDPDRLDVVVNTADDDVFFATAKLGSARYIVSEDEDQLAVKEHDGIRVVTAEEFLRILDEKAQGEGDEEADG